MLDPAGRPDRQLTWYNASNALWNILQLKDGLQAVEQV